MLLGLPLLALVLLVVIKTAADLRGHSAERRKFAGAEHADWQEPDGIPTSAGSLIGTESKPHSLEP
ncbi:MAG: hypothetical protein ABR537_11290 [Gemmatimonadales bacterium]